MKRDNYKTLYLMLIVSFFIMYIVMFLNLDRLSHFYINLTRVYMAILMVSPMAILMILLMGKMFSNKKKNMVIFAVAILIFSGALIMLRAQTFIDDREYMKAMIPHHSSAILTSQEANLQDSEVKELSVQIIQAQEREIRQMKEILDRLSG